MKKELKDYLHLHLGCEFLHLDDFFVETKRILNGYFIERWNENCKLLLRPLSDMTDEEAMECGNLDYNFSDEPDLNKWTHKDFDTLNSSNQFVYLLSKHFDIFGLIEAGLAIDSTTLNKNK